MKTEDGMIKLWIKRAKNKEGVGRDGERQRKREKERGREGRESNREMGERVICQSRLIVGAAQRR
jgi:hypothetical protein